MPEAPPEAPADALRRHLAALPEPALRRLGRGTGVVAPTRTLLESALVGRLPSAVPALLAEAGENAPALVSALLDAGTAVRRADLAGLLVGGADTLEELEDRGLVAAVRPGPGLPELVVPGPGLEDALAACVRSPAPTAPSSAGAARAGAQRRFELALLVAAVARVRPRLTRSGTLHRADLTALGELLQPLGQRASRLEAAVGALLEDGALAPDRGHLAPVPSIAPHVGLLRLRRALAELIAPSLPEAVPPVVSSLVHPHRARLLSQVVGEARAALLRDRAALSEDAVAELRPARAELKESLAALLGLGAVVVLDAEGRPATADGAALERAGTGSALHLAADPDFAACVLGRSAPTHRHGRGHVQPSYELVADDACDADVLATTGLFATLLRADRAAVLRLEERSVARGAALGLPVREMLAALRALAGREVPENVERSVRDWAAKADGAAAPLEPMTTPARIEDLCAAARAVLRL